MEKSNPKGNKVHEQPVTTYAIHAIQANISLNTIIYWMYKIEYWVDKIRWVELR